MLGRIGVKVRLNIMPKAKYFEKIGPKRYDSSFNLLGWTPSSLDSYGVLTNTVRCRDAEGRGGTFNFGGYCNPQIDALLASILVEDDMPRRNELIAEAFRLLHADVGTIPLHQQSLAWGVSRKINVAQRADNQVRFDKIWMQ
jgi:peptide/nickel transport system substrate-binding protein